jgi:hypothetical protein
MNNQLRAGAGAAEIVFPEEMFPVEGFVGIHDNPHVRILLLESNTKMALVAMELVMGITDVNEWITQYLVQQFDVGKEHVWLHMTHAITTPHAPGGPLISADGKILPPPPDMGMMPVPNEEDVKKRAFYTEAIKNSVKKATAKALETLQDAEVGVGTGTCDVNANRDVETPLGWWIGLNGTGYSNKMMTIVHFRGTKGTAIASLISYGIKPCAIDNSQMKEQKRLISSDVPGVACTMLEQVTGAPALFCMSAAGNQIPKEQTLYDKVDEKGNITTVDNGVEHGLALVDKYGTRMGKDAISIVASIREYQRAVEITVKQGTIPWERKARTRMKISQEADFKAEGMGEIPWYVATLGNLAFAATKPEMNAESERQLRDQSNFEHTLLFTMVNGGMKYMPDQSSYDRNTWEAQSAMFMPGAAEAFVKTVTEVINEH